MVVDVLKEETGCGWFTKFDHDIAGVQVCVDKVVEEEHVLLIIREHKKFH